MKNRNDFAATVLPIRDVRRDRQRSADSDQKSDFRPPGRDPTQAGSGKNSHIPDQRLKHRDEFPSNQT